MEEKHKIICYWDLLTKKNENLNGFDFQNDISMDKAVDTLDRLCRDSAHKRLMSDVPLGIMLSDGMDSNLLLHYIAEKQKEIKTFTMGFGASSDELGLARYISKKYNTEHREFLFKRDDFSILEEAISFMDSPIGDFNLIAWYIFCKFIKKDVKVILCGQGMDEMLAGYVHHAFFQKAALFHSFVKSSFPFRCIGKTLKLFPAGFLDILFDHPARFGKKERQRLIKFFNNFELSSNSYSSLVTVFDDEELKKLCTGDFFQYPAPDMQNYKAFLEKTMDKGNSGPFIDELLMFEKKYWLSDFTFEFLDRVSMANGLELRVPYLDHRIIEFLEKLPTKYKLNLFGQKILLTKLAKKKLAHIVGVRKKLGFYVPIDKWSEKDICVLVDRFLNRGNIKKHGLFNYNYVEQLFKDFWHSPMLAAKQIFNLVIFVIWYEKVFCGSKYY